MTDVLVVTNETVHPTVTGGRVRMAGLIEALTPALSVDVLEPLHSSDSILKSLRPGPRRGATVVDPRRISDRATRSGARALLYTHSYLEPVGPRLGLPMVVDFPNLEVDRQRRFTATGHLVKRLSSALEACKAHWWEPRTARRAAVAIAVTESDATKLRSWGATRVLVVPNASRAVETEPSAPDGYVAYVANMEYPPNAAAGRHLLDQVWPLVLAREPTARLRIAGRGSTERFATGHGVVVRGEIEDLAELFRGASMVVAPVLDGAGTQLKVVEALAHGRIVVATEYSAASAPPEAALGCISTSDSAEMADAIVRLLRDLAERHSREQTLAGAIPSWSDVARPLVEALREILG